MNLAPRQPRLGLCLGLYLGAALLLAACGDKAAKPPAEAPAPAASQTTPPTPVPTTAPDAWASLDGLIGKYPADTGLFDTSVIAPDLKALLGDRFAAFKTNMQVGAPLLKDGEVLYTTGNKVHEGGSEMAYLLVDPAQHALEVGLWRGGKLETLTRPAGATIAKPKDVQTLIANAAP